VREKNELLGVEPALVHGDISVDAWVLLVSAADSPRGGADHLVVVDNWSAGVALAGVLAADVEDAGAEHAAEDRAVVVVSVVADRVLDDVDVDAPERVGVVSDDAGGGVAPAADADIRAVGHPFAVTRWRKGHRYNGAVVFCERTRPLQDGEVVLLVAAVVLSAGFPNLRDK
jgi:hypothetical protein